MIPTAEPLAPPVLGHYEMDGKQPLWPNSAIEKHIKPALVRAGITKRIGWHSLRNTFGTWLHIGMIGAFA